MREQIGASKQWPKNFVCPLIYPLYLTADQGIASNEKDAREWRTSAKMLGIEKRKSDSLALRLELTCPRLDGWRV
jgi:hypothetical protein